MRVCRALLAALPRQAGLTLYSFVQLPAVDPEDVRELLARFTRCWRASRALRM